MTKSLKSLSKYLKIKTQKLVSFFSKKKSVVDLTIYY